MAEHFTGFIIGFALGLMTVLISLWIASRVAGKECAW